MAGRGGEGGTGHGLLPADALDGPTGEPPAGAGERGGDRGVAGESGQGEGLDDVADDVGEAADGGIRLEEGADGLAVGSGLGLALPAEDRADRDPEGAGGLHGGEGEKRPESEDAESGLGGVVGPLALGELVPAGAEDVERLAEKRGVQDLLLDLGEAVEGGVLAIPVLPQSPGEGEPEEVGGLHEGSQGQGVEVASPHRGTEEAVEVGGGHGGSASRVPSVEGTRGTGRLPLKRALARRSGGCDLDAERRP